MKKIVRFVRTLALGGILAVGGLVFLYEQDKLTVTNGSGIVTEVTTIDVDLLKQKLTDVGELVTQDYNYTALETFESQKQIEKFNFNIPFTKNGFTLTYDGTIKAGIDFTTIKLDVDEDTKTVTVTVPQAYIISSEVNLDSMKVLDTKNSVFNPITPEDANNAQRELKSKAESEAVEKGLLKNAQKNAETLLKGLLTGMPYMEYYTLNIQTVQ